MTTHQFTVKIEAQSTEQAKEILSAMFDIKKALSTEDLLLFAKKIKEKPSLIQKAKMFL